MQNRTQSTDNHYSADADAIRVRKPDWMSDERWQLLKAEIVEHLDQLVAAAKGGQR